MTIQVPPRPTKRPLSDELHRSISHWLSINLPNLVHQLHHKAHPTRMRSRTRHSYDVTSRVLASPYVQSFPCVHNVRQAALSVLRDLTLSKTRVVVRAGTTVLAFPSCTPLPDPCMAYITAPMPLRRAEQYWAIVNLASDYDAGYASFENDVRKVEMSWMREATRFPRVPCQHVPLEQPCLQQLEDLVPVASVSRAVRQLVQIDDARAGGAGSAAGWVLVNDDVYSFWNSKLIFCVQRGVGVAVDTVSGAFYDALIEYRNDRWECRLARPTTDRWASVLHAGFVQWDRFRTLKRDIWLQQRIEDSFNDD